MSGLLSQLLSGFPIKPSQEPVIKDNNLEIRLTAQELKDLFFSKVDPRYKDMIDLRLENNQLILIFKLK